VKVELLEVILVPVTARWQKDRRHVILKKLLIA